ncbi:hypothetical protein PR048_021639 [Dryococelus australis]|uniref:Uncharacterized protein n=1 Tax=Dryococelus australis TaxID=614101 RepID=A0ABQ9GYS0_9NEOP|nr:hypothetical protein PR048_021639 [Dryococelus australis]
MLVVGPRPQQSNSSTELGTRPHQLAPVLGKRQGEDAFNIPPPPLESPPSWLLTMWFLPKDLLHNCGSKLYLRSYLKSTQKLLHHESSELDLDRDEINFKPMHLVVPNLDPRSAAIVDKCMTNMNSKYQSSPVPSRSFSQSSSLRAGSPLPVPVSYRMDCMSAAAKRYKYLRRLIKFQQMDFEFAFWQMWYLFTSPQKVYRIFQSRKRKGSDNVLEVTSQQPSFDVQQCHANKLSFIVVDRNYTQQNCRSPQRGNCRGMGPTLAGCMWYGVGPHVAWRPVIIWLGMEADRCRGVLLKIMSLLVQLTLQIRPKLLSNLVPSVHDG